MTDKEQIMIDGVDVMGCVYRDSENKCCCDSSKKNEGEERLTGRGGCAYNPNCHFKQQARKTQECEQKEKEINELHLIIDRLLEASGYDKNISTAEDFEDVYSDIDYKVGLLEELKQECEELKETLNSLTRGVVMPMAESEVIDLTDCYRKALEEIEGIAKNFGSYAAWQEQRINKILDIINKVKGEDNGINDNSK